MDFYLSKCYTEPTLSPSSKPEDAHVSPNSISSSIDALRALAPSGYVNSYYRSRVWPLLLGISREDVDPDYAAYISEDHPYYDQIQKDVARSCTHHDIHTSLLPDELVALRVRLGRQLHALFSRHPHLHYVQGIHDVATVTMTVCADDDALGFALLERLCLVHLRDSLQPSLDRVIALMSLVLPLLASSDSALYLFLKRSELSSFFTLSWLLTWLSHNIASLQDTARVFDFLLASHPLMPLYLCVAIILSHKQALLALPPEMTILLQFFQAQTLSAADLDAAITPRSRSGSRTRPQRSSRAARRARRA